ncbi:MAG: hypothetical protein RBR23_06935 [Arcobacteraceae bacterium]|jgi:hypothetical protein|nr:hypothetical protein [Arcobacteraceae bacterium]
MKKIALSILVALIGLSHGYANDVFKAKQENMKAKLTDKLGQSTSKEAQEFAKQKMGCIDAAKTEQDLKVCKDKFPPQKMDELMKK